MSDGLGHTGAGADDLSSPEAREVLRRRAEALARNDEEEPAGETLRFLVFRVGEDGYALPAQAVREIVTGYPVARIPCTPPHVVGVTSIRGEIVSVTDLRTLLDAERPQEVTSRPAIVVDVGEVSGALVVDEVLDVVDVPLAELEPPIVGRTWDASGAEGATLVKGSMECGGRMVSILDGAVVLTPIDEAT